MPSKSGSRVERARQPEQTVANISYPPAAWLVLELVGLTTWRSDLHGSP